MNDTIYHERQLTPMRNGILLLIVALGLLAVSLTWPSAESWGAALAFAAAFLLAWIFTGMDIVVTTAGVHFGFSLFRKFVARDRLEVGEISEIPFWYGIGIHFVRPMWVWNARLGRGVHIRAGRTNYLIGSGNPEQLQHALLQVSSRRITP